MRTFAIFFFALALATTVVTPAPGQLTPCKPDCPDTDFGPLQNYTITLPGNCQIEVTYATRLACDTWQDLYIEFVKTVPMPPSPACQVYWSMSAKDLLWMVTQKMAEANPMGFTTPSPGCTTDWRVIKGSCWFQAFDPATGRYSSSYCEELEESVCCLEPYEVCFDEFGNTTCFEPQSAYPANGVCDPNLQEPGPCEPACGNPSWATADSCS